MSTGFRRAGEAIAGAITARKQAGAKQQQEQQQFNTLKNVIGNDRLSQLGLDQSKLDIIEQSTNPATTLTNLFGGISKIESALAAKKGTPREQALEKAKIDAEKLGIQLAGTESLSDIGRKTQEEQRRQKVLLEKEKPKTLEEAKALAGSEVVASAVGNIVNILDKEEKEMDFFQQVIIDSGNQVLATGETEDFISELNALKAIIPFAKGGKQLTPFEAKQLFRLVEVKGKKKETIKKDLKRFGIEFNKLREGIGEEPIDFGFGDKEKGEEEIKLEEDITKISDDDLLSLLGIGG